MWDTFLNKSYSASSCGLHSSPSYCKKKTDLLSVEYKNYIRKDILDNLLYKNSMNNLKENNKNGPKGRKSRDEKLRKQPTTAPSSLSHRIVDVPKVEEKQKEKHSLHVKDKTEKCAHNRICKCHDAQKCVKVRFPEKSGEKGHLQVIYEDKRRSVQEDSRDSSKINNKSKAYSGKSGDISMASSKPLVTFNESEKCVLYKDLPTKLGKKQSRTNKSRASMDKKPSSKTSHKLFLRVSMAEQYDSQMSEKFSQKTMELEGQHFPSTKTFLIPDFDSFERQNWSLKIASEHQPKLTSIFNGRIRLYQFGERGSGTRTRSGRVQDFYQIRDECLSNGTLFEDPEFPATDSSLFFSQRPDRYYEWRRPNEIVDNPEFFVEGYSRFDVQQGELGDCWLLAAAANLTLYRRLFFQIVPDDQDFDDKYAGVFHFRFWQYGKWVDVVIDDRLPTYGGELIFLHSTEKNEFWSALLEKAYAKLHGSYEALKGGSTCEAMEDFTGGVTEMYEMEACPPNLFQIILKAYERSSLMGCSIEPDPNVVEAQTPEGLVRGHAYSVTSVKYVDIQTPNVTGKIPLLRLRNPWGNESEWNGAWSDGAPEWRFISESEKEELGLTFDNDGEFWMSFKDFQKHFSRIEICNLNPDSLSEEELQEGHKKKWEISVFEGEWVRGVTAGGCRNFLESFWHNPQYRITLTEVDDGENEQECTMIVALMQKNRRHLRHAGGDLLTIGFAIYHLPYPDRVPKPLDVNFFRYNASVARSPSFINLREVSCRFKLPPGTYCIVPSTFDPNEEGEFLLRIFTEKENVMEENDEEVGYGEVDVKVTEKTESPEEKEATDKIYESFLKLAGEDQEVDWRELKEILDYAMQKELMLTSDGFSKDICRSMVAMLDGDRSGKLGYQEFQELWVSLRNWKNAWLMYDADKSGTFSGFELREALNAAGYKINSKVLAVLMHRYGNKNGEIHFDDFMMCAIKLKNMLDVFNEKVSDETNTASFTKEEWLEATLYT